MFLRFWIWIFHSLHFHDVYFSSLEQDSSSGLIVYVQTSHKLKFMSCLKTSLSVYMFFLEIFSLCFKYICLKEEYVCFYYSNIFWCVVWKLKWIIFFFSHNWNVFASFWVWSNLGFYFSQIFLTFFMLKLILYSNFMLFLMFFFLVRIFLLSLFISIYKRNMHASFNLNYLDMWFWCWYLFSFLWGLFLRKWKENCIFWFPLTHLKY